MKNRTVDQTAKELFGRTLTTAHNIGVCVSCNTRVLRRRMTKEQKEAYKDHGFCAACEATTI